MKLVEIAMTEIVGELRKSIVKLTHTLPPINHWQHQQDRKNEYFTTTKDEVHYIVVHPQRSALDPKEGLIIVEVTSSKSKDPALQMKDSSVRDRHASPEVVRALFPVYDAIRRAGFKDYNMFVNRSSLWYSVFRSAFD